MYTYNDDIVDEVYQHRKEALEEHGGIQGYREYLALKQADWEAQGFKFLTPDEVEHNRIINENKPEIERSFDYYDDEIVRGIHKVRAELLAERKPLYGKEN